MNKVNVSICSSPTCYIQGARLFKELGTLLCANLQAQVELTGSTCNQLCAKAGCPLAPCVQINGKRIDHAASGDVLQAIRTELSPAKLVA